MLIRVDDIHNNVIRLCILLGLFCSGSALSICIENFSISVLVLSNTLLFLSIMLKNHAKFRISKSKEIVSLYVFLVFIFLSFFFNFSLTGISIWLRIILTIILVAEIVNETQFELLLGYYVNLMAFFAVVSIICYLLFVVMRISTSFMPIIERISGESVRYLTIGFYNIWITEFSRNCGPFWEPSIFAAYLSIALILTIFFDKSQKKFKVCLFLVTILTTQSTGGYLLLALIILMAIWQKNVILSILTLITASILVIIWEPFCIYLLKLNFNLFSKLIYFESMGTSMTRYYSVLINTRIWLESKSVFGTGLVNIDKLYVYYRDLIAPVTLSPAQTSTSTLMIAALGIGGVYYQYLWIRSIARQKVNLVTKILFLFCILIILNQTPHTYFFLTYYLLFSLLKGAKNTGTEGSCSE